MLVRRVVLHSKLEMWWHVLLSLVTRPLFYMSALAKTKLEIFMQSINVRNFWDLLQSLVNGFY